MCRARVIDVCVIGISANKIGSVSGTMLSLFVVVSLLLFVTVGDIVIVTVSVSVIDIGSVNVIVIVIV